MAIKEKPLITIIMPVFNLESYVEESIKSVTQQSYENIELIVVDDASVDRSKRVVEGIARNDPRIRLIECERNKGVSAARNLGLNYAQGTWVCFLDGDDLLLPGAIEARVLAAQANPEADMISSDFFMWYPEENKFISKVSENRVWSHYFKESTDRNAYLKIESPHHAFMDTVLTQLCVVMVRASIIKELNGFDTSLPMYEDVYMWLLIASKSRFFVYVPIVSACYRQRTGSLTKADDPPTKYAPTVFKKLLSVSEYKPYTLRLRNKIIDHIQINTYWYRERGKKLDAIKSAVVGVLWGYDRKDVWKNLFASVAFRP